MKSAGRRPRGFPATYRYDHERLPRRPAGGAAVHLRYWTRGRAPVPAGDLTTGPGGFSGGSLTIGFGPAARRASPRGEPPSSIGYVVPSLFPGQLHPHLPYPQAPHLHPIHRQFHPPLASISPSRAAGYPLFRFSFLPQSCLSPSSDLISMHWDVDRPRSRRANAPGPPRIFGSLMTGVPPPPRDEAHPPGAAPGCREPPRPLPYTLT